MHNNKNKIKQTPCFQITYLEATGETEYTFATSQNAEGNIPSVNWEKLHITSPAHGMSKSQDEQKKEIGYTGRQHGKVACCVSQGAQGIVLQMHKEAQI